MEQLIAPLLILVVAGLAVVIFLLLKKGETGNGEKLVAMMERLSQLTEQNRELRQAMDNKLAETHKTTQEQIGQTMKTVQGITDQSAKLISNVTERLTKLDETNKQVIGFAQQLQSLENILKNPKQRGVLGEYYLEAVLKNVLPPGSYQMQYSFKDETIVDAVVFIDKQIIPIDSKFSLENYNRLLETRDPEEQKKYKASFVNDLKIRIDETAKYVKPEENTMEFAFMFIPSEAVFYDLLINKVGVITGDDNNLINYAGKKKVIIVSPTSFLAYLQTVLQGLRKQKISEQAQEVIKWVEKLNRHLMTYNEYLQKLGNNLSTTVNSYNNAYKEFGKIDKDIMKITKDQSKIEVKQIEKPE